VRDDFSQNIAGEDAHPQGWLTHCESSMRKGKKGLWRCSLCNRQRLSSHFRRDTASAD
jgi:endonuclease YncB( thermonuclease family)